MVSGGVHLARRQTEHFPADRMLLDISFGENMHDAAMRILPMARIVRGVRVTNADISGNPGKTSYHRRLMAIEDILMREEVGESFLDLGVQGKMNKLHGYIDEAGRSTTEFLSVSILSGGIALRGVVDYQAARRVRLRLVASMPNFGSISEEDSEAIYGVNRLGQGQRLGRFALKNGIDNVVLDEDQLAGMSGDDAEEFAKLLKIVRIRPDEQGRTSAIRITDAFANGAGLVSIAPPANVEVLNDLLDDVSHLSQKKGIMAQ